MHRHGRQVVDGLHKVPALTLEAPKQVLPKVGAAAAGFFYATACYKFGWLGDATPARHLLLTLPLLGPVVIALSAASSERTWLIVPSLWVGIAIGVITDVALDRTSARNLFPIEIVWWVTLSSPVVIVGTVMGALLKRGKKSTQSP